MVYGYVRVRPNAENRDLAEQRQAEVLRERDGAEKIIVETDGKQLPDLLLRLEPGDEVHVVTLDRLARSAGRMLDILEIFRQKNITLYSDGKKVSLEPFDLEMLKAEILAHKETTELLSKILSNRKKSK